MYIVTVTDTNIINSGGIELFFDKKAKKCMIEAIELLLDRCGETIKIEIDFIPPKED